MDPRIDHLAWSGRVLAVLDECGCPACPEVVAAVEAWRAAVIAATRGPVDPARVWALHAAADRVRGDDAHDAILVALLRRAAALEAMGWRV